MFAGQRILDPGGRRALAVAQFQQGGDQLGLLDFQVLLDGVHHSRHAVGSSFTGLIGGRTVTVELKKQKMEETKIGGRSRRRIDVDVPLLWRAFLFGVDWSQNERRSRRRSGVDVPLLWCSFLFGGDW